MTTSWILAEYWATPNTVVAAREAFLQAGSIGLEIDDGIGPVGEPKYPRGQILLKSYYDKAEALEQAIAHAFTKQGLAADAIKLSDLPREDWQRNFVLSCTAFKVEPDIFIVPTFEAEDFKIKHTGQLFIEMDPENAFGTGQHETTKLCLTALSNYLSKRAPEEKSSLQAVDIGCGSGILAILMKKLLVGSVLATEVDESALITASRNAQKNAVSFDLKQVDEEYIYQEGSFDLVVANILAPVLIAMAENIVGACRMNAHIVLSGILCEQADAVIRAFGAQGADLIEQKVMNDWCALIFTRAD